MIHVICLGAGRQSSTKAVMAAHGEIEPMPDLAIFADTCWEPAHVYETLAWLEKVLPFPLVRVSAGNIRNDNVTARARGKKIDGDRWASLPYYTSDGTIIWDRYGRGKIKEGKIKRQCTAEYKIDPIEKHLKREVLGLRPRQRLPKEPVISQWRGITREEIWRLKPSEEPWYEVRYPLALEKQMTASDCLRWLREHGYPEPKRSACIGCPFHKNDEWRDMRDNRPEEWADAVDFDRAIRKAGGMRGDTFLHRSCLPLDNVDLSTEEERGQGDMFNNYCATGACFT